MDSVTVDQRGEILALLKEGLSNREIAQRIGATPGQVAAIKAHITMGIYGKDDANNEVIEAVDTAFGLERALQAALPGNIRQLDSTLAISDGGKEQSVPSGRIDITARDAAGTTVVIELKTGTADRDAIGQILAYIGDLMVSTGSVRGIAKDFSPRAIAAARAARDVQLVRYGFRFSFEPVTAASIS